jgi:anti-sigma factor RsiW
MRDKHIILLLDNNRFGSLSEPESSQIEAHIDTCAGCRQAYVAARAAATLFTARAAETIEPSPFFSTRVMAVIREQQNTPSLLDFVTMWRAARGYVLSALSVVVLLAGLTFLTPDSGDRTLALWQNNDSPEAVVFGDEVSHIDESPSNEQVIDVVFTPEETDATNQK